MPKRTKSIKETDLKAKKPWLKKNEASTYDIETKELNKTILIVGEGQTEKLYFESFPVLTLTVKAVDLRGQTKRKLIESTEEIVKNTNDTYDEIWCVFDMDVKGGAMEFADFDNAVVQGQSKGYKIAYSNDAFELWFYLHYQYTDQKNHRAFYYEALSDFWGLNYVKDGKSYNFSQSIYQKLEFDERASQRKAIERAERLYQDQMNLSFHMQNPVTMVYELVQYLNDNKRK